MLIYTFFFSEYSIKQEGHDGPEVAHLYIGPWSEASLNPQGFSLNKHPLEDVSC
jgi:hypothetical protein